ncbi:RICIN domain-containing protein [Bacillus manliponensis]|uniref:RICIN domain-containing protein n=1 Tax=Bacillus manliponensis TaxID=574376 RepID=UPI003510E972
MKSISKKVMAGLLVGATSLSICAPTSDAASLEKNRYYSVHLKSNLNLAWDVYGQKTYDDAGILLYKPNGNDNQQFVFFPLDGGTYAIVNKNSGKPVRIGNPIAIDDGVRRMRLADDDGLLQKSWTGAPAEQWYLRDQGNGYYEIVNQGYGKVASYAWEGTLAQNWTYVDLDNANPSDGDRVFRISKDVLGGLPVQIPGMNFEYGTFSLPQLPTVGTRPNAPDYNGGVDPYQQLPQTSNSVVVGASLIPCIMVNDSQVSDYTKIHESPYYTLVKEEYWDKSASTVLTSGATQSLSFKTGMSSTDQQKMTDTLSIKVGADLGFKFGDKTATLKGEITRTLQTETSTSNTELTEDTVTTTLTGEAGKTTGYTQYQLATKYTLYRNDGSAVSGSWTVKNNKVTVLRKNSQ